MKARGRQGRAYESSARPTTHLVGCLDETPFPRGAPRNGQRQKREKSIAPLDISLAVFEVRIVSPRERGNEARR